ncbi:VOC family protein [Roseovarius sp. 2305UL8-3]|uniref:VOC family protein n=1 Tax=Roseovarius conchicola TaxID=3121636 RepID=UPI0035281393
MPSRIAAITFEVANPEAQAAFYQNQLGMTVHDRCDGVRVGYHGDDADLIFRQGTRGISYCHSRDDRYWKIGITLPNLDLACDRLKRDGVAVSAPHQFQDIGYMAHLTDPEGFQIELLQHTFEGEPRTSEGDPLIPLGGGATVGQVTYRTADISSELKQYRDKLGMRLISLQPVHSYGFDLYFLTLSADQPPEKDIESVTNRPWLWQRPYTLLEFQHFPEGDPDLFVNDLGAVQGEITIA